MSKNSAVPMLLARINQLEKRIEILEWLQHPTYTNITSTVPITATRGSYTSMWATPTISRTEAVAYSNAYEDRLHDIERQLDEISNTRFEVRDGNLYITWIGNDWENN
jgi:hypothetical protein